LEGMVKDDKKENGDEKKKIKLNLKGLIWMKFQRKI
jgi:hypothetical protein